MTVSGSLMQFKETETGEPFSLQNGKLLKVELSGMTIQAKLGSMVAYQGDVKFEHAGSGGMGKLIKKATTGEGQKLMKMEGGGQVFLADQAQDIHIVKIDNDTLTVNGPNLLAFDAGIEWDIKRVEGASGVMGGGLYNTQLTGTGAVAVLSDGPPLLIQLDGTPTFADPQAAITWSSGVSTSIKTDVNVKNLIGKGSGESIQMGFGGSGWLLVQPSEGVIKSVAAQGGGGGVLGNVLGG